MLMNILERIDLVDIPAFIIATIHILRMRGVVPPYPSAMLQLMILREEKTHDQPNGLQNMPKELLLAIGQSLTPNEKIHMVLATYHLSSQENAADGFCSGGDIGKVSTEPGSTVEKTEAG
ncbi:MAG: hypothetical protein Q9171_007349 [Xanthocarpia ochracea]